MERRRGLAPATTVGYRLWISDFLRRSLPRGGSVKDLKRHALQRYVEARAPELVWVTLHAAINNIQAFLRDCHDRGPLTERFDLIELPRGFRPARPPKAMPWKDIKRLLASIDLAHGRGSRDHAIPEILTVIAGSVDGEEPFLSEGKAAYGAGESVESAAGPTQSLNP